jgi:hypothetical protein
MGVHPGDAVGETMVSLYSMTKERSTIGAQAAFLCCGYNVGYYSTSDIEWWAIQQIDAMDEPPLAIIDLATLRDTNPIDVMNLLRSLGGTLSSSLTTEMRIGFLGLLYDVKRISLNTAIGGLFALVHDDGVTDDQRSMIYWLDDGCDLAIAGTYGTIGQVEADFRSFVRPYADSLKAQKIELLGESSAYPR